EEQFAVGLRRTRGAAEVALEAQQARSGTTPRLAGRKPLDHDAFELDDHRVLAHFGAASDADVICHELDTSGSAMGPSGVVPPARSDAHDRGKNPRLCGSAP